MKKLRIRRSLLLSVGILLLLTSLSVFSFQVFRSAKKTQAEVGQLQIGTASSTNTFTGTMNLPGGSRWTSDGKLGIGTSNPTAQLVLADIYAAGGKNLMIGDDTYLTDVDAANTLGIYSVSSSTVGAVKLGSSGPTLTGNANGTLTSSGTIIGDISGSAGSVAWSGVTSKPTLPSSQEGSRYTTNFNSILSTGFFNAEGTPANAPNQYGQLIAARGIDTGLQIYGGYASDNLYFRGWWSSGGGFSTWRTVIHSGNIGSQSVNYANTAGAAYPYRVGGVVMQMNWSGQSGQPTWLWGGNDGTNFYVYNPSNFSVNYASYAAEANNNYFYVRGTSPSTLYVDTDQGQTRYVYHNGGSIGFLNSSGNWVLRADDTWIYGNFSGQLSGNATSATYANYASNIAQYTGCGSGNVRQFGYNRDAGQYGALYLCRLDNGTGYAWTTMTQTLGNPDLSEYVRVDDLSIEAGDIVSVSDASYFENDPYNRFLTKRAVADDASRVLGIISTDKGLILNQAADPSKNLDYTYLRPLALSGRVPVKVSSENGPIKKGDPLTVSSVPGVATKATKPGQIIGKALETYDNSDPRAVGKVLVFVNISWYDPDVYLTSTGDLHISVDNTGKTEVKTKDGTLISRIGAFAEAVIGKLRVGVLEVKKLIVDGVDIVEKLNKLTATVEEQQKTIDALKKEVEALKK